MCHNSWGPIMRTQILNTVHAVLLPLFVLLASVQNAGAAFPGENGLIAFQSWFDFRLGPSIVVMNPDGTGQTMIASPSSAVREQ